MPYRERPVLDFIKNFQSPENEITFTQDYCLYFAKMLQEAYQRGRIMLDFYEHHIYWLDVDDNLYDINGLMTADWKDMYLVDWDWVDEETRNCYRHSIDLMATAPAHLLDDVYLIQKDLQDKPAFQGNDIAKIYRLLYNHLRELPDELFQHKTLWLDINQDCIKIENIYSKRDFIIETLKAISNEVIGKCIDDWSKIEFDYMSISESIKNKDEEIYSIFKLHSAEVPRIRFYTSKIKSFSNSLLTST